MMWDFNDFSVGDLVRVQYPDGSSEETVIVSRELPNLLHCHDGRVGLSAYPIPVEWVTGKFVRHYWIEWGKR